jgi:hypothetical protein
LSCSSQVPAVIGVWSTTVEGMVTEIAETVTGIDMTDRETMTAADTLMIGETMTVAEALMIIVKL